MVMEHLRLNGAYWGLTTLDVLGKLDTVDQDEVIPWIMQCQHESGMYAGFSFCINYMPFTVHFFTLFWLQQVLYNIFTYSRC